MWWDALTDLSLRTLGNGLFPWVSYPCILGSDIAGEVAEIGGNVKNVKVGDRVTGMAIGLKSDRPADAAFQAYTVLPAHMASKIPDSVSYESASAIPLPLSTAASGLFQEHYLALPFPTAPARKSGGGTILIVSASGAE